ncbi:MAG: hypothetical protein EON55_17485, partial [Alphaproteobacteria bacterium]
MQAGRDASPLEDLALSLARHVGRTFEELANKVMGGCKVVEDFGGAPIKTPGETVDWSMPIEAVHVDGRVLPAKANATRKDDRAQWCTWPDNATYADYATGITEYGWRIRNRQDPDAETGCADDQAFAHVTAGGLSYLDGTPLEDLKP